MNPADEFEPLTVSAGRHVAALCALYVATVGPFLASALS